MKNSSAFSAAALSLGLLTSGCQTNTGLDKEETQLATAAQGSEHTSFPIDFTVLGCEGQTITVQGTSEANTNLHTDGTGRTHFQDHFIFKNVTATDEFGNTYNVRSESHVTNRTSGPNNQGFNFTYTYQFTVVSPGPGGNLFIKGLSHLTVTPAGETTASFSDLTSTCRP